MLKLVVGFRKYGFWAQVAQIQFLDSRPQSYKTLGNFIILLKAAYDSG